MTATSLDNGSPATSSDGPAPITIAVDRVRAVVMALWRLLASGVFAGAAYLIAVQIGNWGLLWRTQPMTWIALGVLCLLTVITGTLLTLNGLRWLLLACWPRRVGVFVDAQRIHTALGPFGTKATQWSDIHCDTVEGFDADMLSQLPDDAFTPILRDRNGDDLFAHIQSRTGIVPESLTRELRPFFETCQQRANT